MKKQPSSITPPRSSLGDMVFVIFAASLPALLAAALLIHLCFHVSL
jgi:hypothetical protein